MTGKGLDFKHKEVVNINTGKKAGICARCMCRLKHGVSKLNYCTW